MEVAEALALSSLTVCRSERFCAPGTPAGALGIYRLSSSANSTSKERCQCWPLPRRLNESESDEASSDPSTSSQYGASSSSSSESSPGISTSYSSVVSSQSDVDDGAAVEGEVVDGEVEDPAN